MGLAYLRTLGSFQVSMWLNIGINITNRSLVNVKCPNPFSPRSNPGGLIIDNRIMGQRGWYGPEKSEPNRW